MFKKWIFRTKLYKAQKYYNSHLKQSVKPV